MKSTIFCMTLILAISPACMADHSLIELARTVGCGIFADYLNKTQYILPELEEDVPYTLFCVTDSRMTQQIARYLDNMSPYLIERSLSYFFVNYTVFADDFENDMFIMSDDIAGYEKRPIRLNKYSKPSGEVVFTVDGREVLSSDHVTSNNMSVVHVVDGYLFHSIQTSGRIIEITSSLSFMQQEITEADLLATISETYGSYTVFAVRNDEFNQLDPDIFTNTHPSKGIMQGHIVPGAHFSDGFYTGLVLDTLNLGRKINITMHPDGNITINGDEIRVTEERYVRNGVIFYIDGVLTLDTDLKTDTIFDVAAELGCDDFLDYMFKSNAYDTYRDDGPYTLFALSDAGFTDLLRFRLDFLLWPLLQSYMTMHIAEGTHGATSITNDELLVTVQQERYLRMNVYDRSGNQIITINGRPIIDADHVASNGVVHVIDRFLYGVSRITIGDYVEGSGRMDDLETYMLQVGGLIDILKGDGPFTLFAPEDGAFDNLTISDDEMLNSTLQGHVVASTEFRAGFTENTVFTTVNGKKLTVSRDEATGSIWVNGQAMLLEERQMSNGVVHIIDNVITESDSSTTTPLGGSTTTPGDGSTTTLGNSSTTTPGDGSTTTPGDGSTTTDPDDGNIATKLQFCLLSIFLPVALINLL